MRVATYWPRVVHPAVRLGTSILEAKISGDSKYKNVIRIYVTTLK
jgi:hypothetical protein